MTAQAKKQGPPVTKTGNPPYPFRTFWALLLLGINFLVAAIYGGYLNI
ncbi:MAG: photosystem I protein PsaX [Stenomitos rutilans HA7619-LM2]|jgi:photosystem I protein|nr:photosystem I protein PsaX [Stenomitos rutilans HA7619-LM2]